MKALKTIGIIAGGLFLCYLVYNAFFVSSPDVQAIEAKHKEEKKQYEEKLEEHEAEKERLKEEKKQIEAEKEEIKEKWIIAEVDRKNWRKKYIDIRKPVDSKTLKTLEDCIKNFDIVSGDLVTCQVQVAKTEFSLDTCNRLNKVKDKEIVNLNLFIDEQKKEIKTKDTMITQQDVNYKLLINKRQPPFQLTGGLILMYGPEKKVYFGVGVCLGVNLFRFLRF